ncbi:Y-family DNA polymerase [Butyrivibrio sp. MC2021]|uniref:Y-family DNA polymerase n=1 Tax=Butyrivibrio sp. MC2021 TaxID=1408306 RepID=UPI00047B2C68|nr:DNA repair protein [Butyrivibrio sp. MC2021]
MEKERSYICIDLKSFYASVECVERGLDVMTTRLVVADPTRSDKTICLAVSPALKALGIPGRCRVFEIPKHIDYIMAPPRMQKYLDYSAEVYAIYLKYISKDDIHVYSVDEAFMDVTDYLSLYQMSARELGQRIISDIHETLGLRATCGIGTNLFLTKVALDITAKHSPDFIGELDEKTYRETLWDHKPLTDFWRVGKGIANRLATYGMLTMRDIAYGDEDLLYKLFGVNAELLIDHAWGREPVSIQDIRSYESQSHSLTQGQVLMSDYTFEKGLVIAKEMMDVMCLDLVDKELVSKSFTLMVGYAKSAPLPSAKGTFSLDTPTNASSILIPKIAELYTQIVNPAYLVRRMYVVCNGVTNEEYMQYSFFMPAEDLEKNRKVQKAVLEIKNKFGKNAILKGLNFEEGATTRERNNQIGGHKA